MASAEGEARLPTTSREDSREDSREGSREELININNNDDDNDDDDNDNNNNSSNENSDTSSYRSPVSASSCPYRTSRFSDNECALFLDCPTHQRERLPNTENDGEGIPGSAANPLVIDDDTGSSPSAPVPRSRFSTFILDHGSQHHGEGETSTTERTDGPSRPSTEAPITLREALQEAGPRNNSDSTPRPGPGMGVGVPDFSPNFGPNPHPNWQDWPPSRQGQIQGQEQEQRRQGQGQGQGQGQEPGQGPRIEFTLPRWQPDAEVTRCPICGSQFGFFLRKHHCR